MSISKSQGLLTQRTPGAGQTSASELKHGNSIKPELKWYFVYAEQADITDIDSLYLEVVNPENIYKYICSSVLGV